MSARAIAGVLVGLTVLALLPATAQARTERQDLELGVAGTLRNTQDAGSPTKDRQNAVGASVGYFVTDVVELGYGMIVTSSETLDANDQVIASTTVQFHNFFLDYYVYVNPDETAALYFGPSLGIGALQSRTQLYNAKGVGATSALHVGLKYFVSEDTTLYANLEGRGSRFGLKLASALGEVEVTGRRSEATIFFGMTYFFSKGGP